jgi:adenosylcobinamide-phosphate synthase
MIDLLIIALAVIIDLAIGDPPSAFHPVAWLGRLIGALEKIGPGMKSKAGQFIFGTLLTLFTAGLAGAAVWFGFHYLAVGVDAIGGQAIFIYPIIGALFLKSTFTVSGLRKTAKQIRALLDNEDLAEVRFELRALVSRDTAKLSRPQLVSAAVESVAEGLCDSVVAPLFYFIIFGLPGAFVYRAVNTADAMIGYRGKYEYLGKFAARLDDVLNFVPARLAAFLLIIAAWLRGAGGQAGLAAAGEHRKTASPNAGWPMAAMAGALDVTLEKPGHYKLGSGKGKLVPDTIPAALWLFSAASGLWIFICLLWGGMWYALGA